MIPSATFCRVLDICSIRPVLISLLLCHSAIVTSFVVVPFPSQGKKAIRLSGLHNTGGSNNRWSFIPITSTMKASLLQTNLVASTAGSSSRSSTKTLSNNNGVVYQKVVRPPPGVPDILFLAHLVEYLQDQFELPERLPMVYTNKFTDDGAVDAAVVVQWDSPLSPNSKSTTLNVQVVGIYTAASTSDDQRQQKVPNMAMVVVDKAATATSAAASTTKLPPMLANLFADAERKILKALDRGLEDFMAGEIPHLGESSSTQQNEKRHQQTLQQGQESILAEILEDDDKEITTLNLPSKDVIEANVEEKNGVNVTDSKAIVSNTQQQQREAVFKAINQAAASSSNVAQPPSISLDFAVQAAKLAQARRGRQKYQGVQDFAVQAANQAVRRRSSKSKAPLADEEQSTDAGPISIDMSKIRPPVLFGEATGVRRLFMKTISTPKDYLEQQKGSKQENQPPKATAATGKTMNQPARNRSVSFTKEEVVEPSMVATKGRTTKKKIDVKVRESEKEPVFGLNDSLSKSPSNKIIQATQDALTEMEDKGIDMTPEELLADVMKFDEQQEREQAVGVGFVSGAFEKAKDLLREQKERRDERIRQNHIKEATFAAQNAVRDTTNSQYEVSCDVLTIEEELRRMFEAGERIAEDRITITTSKAVSISETTESDVDAIIDSDKTVSRYARVLDDELAELEVRINKSPGEQLDGPKKNPVFDILSGPEVYDLNVDPLSAVNWPGAILGTKKLRLPKELDEAVKQSKFASEVLLSMREVESSDGSQRFMIDERELSAQQISNLRAVVAEAIEIRLIDDPIEIQAEASRLQMVLDELSCQPEERIREIASNYKDLLLSDNFVDLVKNRLNEMADRDLAALRRDDDSLASFHAKERELLGQLVVYAQLLLQEVRALGAELESQQLEVIRSICKVAMDPSHRTEEETALALTDAVRDMRPLFDDVFIAYLKYAVAEEEGRLAREGLLDDPENNQWLYVLKVVRQGVYAEIAKGINRYINHVWYVLRMETPIERRMLLEKLVDVMPTLDVRPFVQVVDNIVGSLGDSVRGDFDSATPLGEMTNKLLQLHRDLGEVLPLERIAEKSRDADEWAAKQKQRLLEQRNLTKQRLQAAQATEHLDGEIETFRRGGESERFD